MFAFYRTLEQLGTDNEIILYQSKVVQIVTANNLFFLVLQEELAEGLHLIDFEQLKIENQTYNEKIEERNEVNFVIKTFFFPQSELNSRSKLQK